MVREVVAGDDGFHAGKLFRLAGVDLLDLGVGMRRAQDAADQLAGRRGVGAELGAAGDLVDAVRAQLGREPTTLNLRFESGALSSGMIRPLTAGLRVGSRMSLAASCTARTILS